MLNVLENYTRLFHVCFFVFSSFKSWADVFFGNRCFVLLVESIFQFCPLVLPTAFAYLSWRFRFLFLAAAVGVRRRNLGVEYVLV